MSIEQQRLDSYFVRYPVRGRQRLPEQRQVCPLPPPAQGFTRVFRVTSDENDSDSQLAHPSGPRLVPRKPECQPNMLQHLTGGFVSKSAHISFTTSLLWAVYFERKQSYLFQDYERQVMIFDIPTNRLTEYDPTNDVLNGAVRAHEASNFARAASERLATGVLPIVSDYWMLILSPDDHQVLTDITLAARNVGTVSVPYRAWMEGYRAQPYERIGRFNRLIEDAQHSTNIHA
ncbi:hypothetical protein H9P43_003360 [Blastocladiella emersonii ATCC 22665]|nr:hypothetical protein H9P43_003360 [Blastocladiella emersonii ATCC 22665]